MVTYIAEKGKAVGFMVAIVLGDLRAKDYKKHLDTLDKHERGHGHGVLCHKGLQLFTHIRLLCYMRPSKSTYGLAHHERCLPHDLDDEICLERYKNEWNNH